METHAVIQEDCFYYIYFMPYVNIQKYLYESDGKSVDC